MATQDLMAQFQGMRDQASSMQPMQQGMMDQGAPVEDDAPAELVENPQPDNALVQFGPTKVDESIVERALEIIDAHPDLRPVDGHRDTAKNKAMKGVDRSWHLKGRALDFSGPLQELYKAAGTARKGGATESLVNRGPDGMILHVAWGE